MPPVPIAHDRPDDFRNLPAERFPEVEFVYPTTAQAITEALARYDPEMTFSIKQPGFPGPHMCRFPHTRRCAGFKWATRRSITFSPNPRFTMRLSKSFHLDSDEGLDGRVARQVPA